MLIIGASGFAYESLEVLLANNYTDSPIYFFDNISETIDPYLIENYLVIQSFDELNLQLPTFEFILGIGNPKHREMMYKLLTSRYNGVPYNLISKNASIGVIGNELKQGLNIMTSTIITSNCYIGNGVLINLNVTIGHNCIIHDFVEICPGVNISGNCEIGEKSFIGTGAVIIPNVKIGQGAIIAAGSVVIKDIPSFTMYAGNPAVFKKNTAE